MLAHKAEDEGNCFSVLLCVCVCVFVCDQAANT